jgi:peptide/nickel transport system permease protein
MDDPQNLTVLPPADEPVVRRIRWRGLPYFSLVVLALLVVAGVGAQWLAPHDPLRGELRLRNLPPFWIAGGSVEYALGTDHLGRDMLSRTLYGARISLVLCTVALLAGGTVGTVLGLLSGWYGGWVDEIIMRLVDLFLSLPLVLLTLVLVVTFGASFPLIVAVLASWLWVRFARVVRGEVLRLKQLDHVALARVAGASTARILTLHILPGVRNTLIVVATLQIGILILLEATLSFLGAGVPPPTPSWGAMVADGRSRLADAWWISTLPGVAILLTLLALNLIGDWLRDVFDPRLQQMG